MVASSRSVPEPARRRARAHDSVSTTSPRRTLDRTLDVVFKMLLTRGPESHELLVPLLTAVIRPPSPFAKAIVRNPELPSADLLDRGVVLDINAQLADGTLIDIEMQSDKRPAFRQRAMF